jgi:aspartyl-tRNA(Asn)/glutamyl-tRNA(Gln) amidotransferase subunit A
MVEEKNLADLTLAEFAAGYRRGDWTSEEVTGAVLERIGKVEEGVKAFTAVDAEGARAAARAADSRPRSPGRGSLLHGAPLALKDNLCTLDLPTTCSSKILAGFRSPYDAAVVSRLRSAGAVIVGKTNLDEFAMGSSTENSAAGATRNPWDRGRIPGGSSGGSAAAVAAGECLAAIGSDTGGSIRQPAAFCGVTGLKPTYGLVSRYGLVAFASSLDQIGPLTRSVEDAAALLGEIAGHDGRDSTSANREVPDYLATLNRGIEGMTFGIPGEYFEVGVDPAVREAVEKAVALLRSLGAEGREVSLPHSRYSVAAYYILATAEASSNLARYDAVRYGYRTGAAGDLSLQYRRSRREGFGTEVKRRIMLGTYALSSGYYDAYYRKAQKVRSLIAGDFSRVFEDVDFLVGPTTPTPAFALGEKTGDPLQMYLSDVFTLSVNLAGLPALSLPCGFSEGGLPLGLQLIGGLFREETILRAGHAFQGETDFHRARPPLAGRGEEG